MKLVNLMREKQRARRPHWPDGVYVRGSTAHRIGNTPVVLNDVDVEDQETSGWYGHLTLVGADPQGRVLPRVELIPNTMYRPESPVVRFAIEEWQPSIADLFATDWTAL